jgi:hypothetical protein
MTPALRTAPLTAYADPIDAGPGPRPPRGDAEQSASRGSSMVSLSAGLPLAVARIVL